MYELLKYLDHDKLAEEMAYQKKMNKLSGARKFNVRPKLNWICGPPK